MMKLSLIAAAAGVGGIAFLLPVPDASAPGASTPAASAALRPVAAEPTAGISESRAYLHNFNLPASGVAIDGYSPVSYFESGKAERGDPRFSAVHNGVTYHLASPEQVAAFAANPDTFIPAYGGWCAFGMAVQDKFPVDPREFEIVDGRLLLFLKNRNVDARRLWNDGEEPELLRKANAHWRKVNGG